MKHDEFIKHVQSVAHLKSKEEAAQATRATLETLKERLVGNEASQLAAQLPKEFKEYLQGREGEDGQHFPIKEFYRRISEKEGIELEQAAIHAQAVFTVLQAAVTPGELADVRANFSDDYEELFVAQSGIAS